MLHYNFTKIFRLREIENPYPHLRKQGFSHNISHRISKNKINSFSLEHLEKICKLLGCTPNDLLEWTPEKGEELLANHPLAALKQELKGVNLLGFLRTMPLHQLSELQNMINKVNQK